MAKTNSTSYYEVTAVRDHNYQYEKTKKSRVGIAIRSHRFGSTFVFKQENGSGKLSERFVSWIVRGSMLELVELSTKYTISNNSLTLDFRTDKIVTVDFLESAVDNLLAVFVVFASGLVRRITFSHPFSTYHQNMLHPSLSTNPTSTISNKKETTLPLSILNNNALSTEKQIKLPNGHECISACVINKFLITILCSPLTDTGDSRFRILICATIDPSMSQENVHQYELTDDHLVGKIMNWHLGGLLRSGTSYGVLAVAAVCHQYILSVCTDGVCRVWSIQMANCLKTIVHSHTLQPANADPLTTSTIKVCEFSSENVKTPIMMLIYSANRTIAHFQVVSAQFHGKIEFNVICNIPSTFTEMGKLIDCVFVNDTIWALWEQRSQVVFKAWSLKSNPGWHQVATFLDQTEEISLEESYLAINHLPENIAIEEWITGNLLDGNTISSFPIRSVNPSILQSVLQETQLSCKDLKMLTSSINSQNLEKTDTKQILTEISREKLKLKQEIVSTINRQIENKFKEAITRSIISEKDLKKRITIECWLTFFQKCILSSLESQIYYGLGACNLPSPCIIKQDGISVVRVCEMIEQLSHSQSIPQDIYGALLPRKELYIGKRTYNSNALEKMLMAFNVFSQTILNYEISGKLFTSLYADAEIKYAVKSISIISRISRFVQTIRRGQVNKELSNIDQCNIRAEIRNLDTILNHTLTCLRNYQGDSLITVFEVITSELVSSSSSLSSTLQYLQKGAFFIRAVANSFRQIVQARYKAIQKFLVFFIYILEAPIQISRESVRVLQSQIIPKLIGSLKSYRVLDWIGRLDTYTKCESRSSLSPLPLANDFQTLSFRSDTDNLLCIGEFVKLPNDFAPSNYAYAGELGEIVDHTIRDNMYIKIQTRDGNTFNILKVKVTWVPKPEDWKSSSKVDIFRDGFLFELCQYYDQNLGIDFLTDASCMIDMLCVYHNMTKPNEIVDSCQVVSLAVAFANLSQLRHVPELLRLCGCLEDIKLQHILGCAYLEIKEFDKAKICFLKAVALKNTPVPWLHGNHVEEEKEGKHQVEDPKQIAILPQTKAQRKKSLRMKQDSFEYYLTLIRLFDQQKKAHLALDFAYAALPLFLKINSQVTLWANVFKYSLSLSRFDEAYTALMSIPNPDKKRMCLQRFILTLIKKRDMKTLFHYSWIGLSTDVEDVLWRKAQNTDMMEYLGKNGNRSGSTSNGISPINPVPNYYYVLYSFLIQHNKYHEAGRVMYVYALRFEREIHPVDSKSLQKQANALLCVINALEMLPDRQWFLHHDLVAFGLDTGSGYKRRKHGDDPLLSPGQVIGLHNSLHNRFVNLDNTNGRISTSVPKRASHLPEPSERFTVVDAGNSLIALYSLLFNRFICVNNKTLKVESGSMKAANSILEPSERFAVIHTNNDQIALYSAESNCFLHMNKNLEIVTSIKTSIDDFSETWTDACFAAVRFDDGLKVVELKHIRKKYNQCISSVELADHISLPRCGFYQDPSGEDTVLSLLKAGLVEKALTIALEFELNLKMVFDGLVDKCIQLQLQEGLPYQKRKNIRIKFEEPREYLKGSFCSVAPSRLTRAQRAWNLLESYLIRYDTKDTNFCYRILVAEKILKYNTRMVLPEWLIRLFAGKNPDFARSDNNVVPLLRLMTKYNMVQEATNLSIQCLKNFHTRRMSNSKLGKRKNYLERGWLPWNFLEELRSILHHIATWQKSQIAKQLLEKLEHAIAAIQGNKNPLLLKMT